MTLFLVSNASFNTIQYASRPHRLVRVRFRTPTFHLVSFSQVYSKPRLNAFECKVNRFVDCFGFIDWTLSNAKLFLFKTFVVWFINWTLSNAVISYFNSTCSNIKLIIFMALVFFLLNAFERYAIFMFVKYLIHTFYFQFKLSRHYYFVQPRTRVQTMQRNGLCCKLHFFLSLFSFTYSVPRDSDWWPVRGMSHVSPYCI